jgi:hypothetical protein
MRVSKRLTALSAIALAGILYVAGAGHAVASPERVQTVQMESSLPHGLRLSADYRYQGKHYKYKYKGKYYNSRVRKHGRWRYY